MTDNPSASAAPAGADQASSLDDAALALFITSSKVIRLVERCLQLGDTVLNFNQYRLLTRVAEGADSMRALHVHHTASPAALSSTVALLVDAGMLERLHNRSDAREVGVALTDKGAEAREAAEGILKQFGAAVLTDVAPATIQELTDALQVIAARTEAFAKRGITNVQIKGEGEVA